MTHHVPDGPLRSTIRLTDSRSSTAEAAEVLERQMAEAGLSAADRAFLRTLRQTQRQLKVARAMAQQSGNLQQLVSRVYRQLYRLD